MYALEYVRICKCMKLYARAFNWPVVCTSVWRRANPFLIHLPLRLSPRTSAVLHCILIPDPVDKKQHRWYNDPTSQIRDLSYFQTRNSLIIYKVQRQSARFKGNCKVQMQSVRFKGKCKVQMQSARFKYKAQGSKESARFKCKVQGANAKCKV